jgi:phosphate transport system substrate-binding protein
MKPIFVALLCVTAAYGSVSLTGSGSTFIAPIASKWCQDFQKSHPDVQISYRAVGSGAGISQAIEGTVDFGATDGPMTRLELESYKALRHANVIHFPAVIGAVVPAYNLPGSRVELNFTPAVLAGIFLGTISKWNDPELMAANPGISLPDARMTVVHRSDGSGTSYVWADYLAKISLQWKLTVGVGTSVIWPVGVGGKGNDGVAEFIEKTPFSIGYLELGYAIRNRLTYGKVRNASGNFIKADLASVTAAAAAAKTMPEDFRVSITNAPGSNSYPIASFSWFLIPEEVTNPAKRQALIEFIRWVLTDGQAEAEGALYAPLPSRIREMELKTLSTIH